MRNSPCLEGLTRGGVITFGAPMVLAKPHSTQLMSIMPPLFPRLAAICVVKLMHANL